MDTVTLIRQKAHDMRVQAIRMALNAGPRGAHLGPGFSIMEITATLFFGGVLRYDAENPRWPERDRFILSKGHGVLGYYTALAEAGYFPKSLLDSFDTENSPLAGHPSRNLDLGVEASTGSLGHGLSIGAGLALCAKTLGQSYTTWVLLGDGESNEGMVWEAAMCAANYRLDNLVAILDYNRQQADGATAEVMDMKDVPGKWHSFGWHVVEVNGHDPAELLRAFDKQSRRAGMPTMVIAHTTKGKGVSFFENSKEWHHYRNFSQELADRALAELAAARPGGEVSP